MKLILLEEKRGNTLSSNMDFTLNELLIQIDGFNTNEDIILIAATNKADLLDDALIRSGRFDKQIVFELPNKQERSLLFDHYLKDKKLHNDFITNYQNNLELISSVTTGLSGADIANITNQSVGLYMKREKFRPNRRH